MRIYHASPAFTGSGCSGGASDASSSVNLELQDPEYIAEHLMRIDHFRMYLTAPVKC